MLYTEGKQIEILLRLVTYANKHPAFDRSVVDKIYEFYMENDYISEDHTKKLNRLYNENKIADFYDDED